METNYYEPDLESKDGRREGLNLKIQRQAQEMGAKLWKLLSSYEWGESDMRNPKKYQKSWGDEAHKNKNRSWDAFANHLINQQPWTHQESAISLESWHDAIHVIVGSGRYSGHMGDTGIAAVRNSVLPRRNMKILRVVSSIPYFGYTIGKHVLQFFIGN